LPTALTALSLATSLLVAGGVGDEAGTTAATDTPTLTGLAVHPDRIEGIGAFNEGREPTFADPDF
jgi:hypothetical protein